MIYFIRDPQADRVKIGFSKNPWERARNLQTGHPGNLVLEAVVAGEKSDERALHERFARRRTQSEWFVWRGDVAAYVAALDGALLAVPASPRNQARTQIRRAIMEMGFGASYASSFWKGHRPWPLDIAAGVWQRTGHEVGPLKDATDAEMAVLAKYAPHFRPSRPSKPQAA